jgi:hypothetical protein
LRQKPHLGKLVRLPAPQADGVRDAKLLGDAGLCGVSSAITGFS